LQGNKKDLLARSFFISATPFARPVISHLSRHTPICGAVSHAQKMYPRLLTQRSSGYT
jgi:hypothetical protein